MPLLTSNVRLKIIMIYWLSNHCPNCDKDLTDAYSEYDIIKDGFECPYCYAILGYKNIYPWIGLILFALGGVSVSLWLACALSSFLSLEIAYIESACIKLDINLGYVSGILFSLSVFMGAYNNSYVLKKPNKSVKQTG